MRDHPLEAPGQAADDVLAPEELFELFLSLDEDPDDSEPPDEPDEPDEPEEEVLESDLDESEPFEDELSDVSLDFVAAPSPLELPLSERLSVR